MSVTVTVESVKPNQSTKWFAFSEKHANHFTSLLAGNTFAYTQTISQDGLTQTRRLIFADQVAADAFLNDPALVPGFTARVAYNETAGIKFTRTIAVT
jgi:hypothetical protein